MAKTRHSPPLEDENVSTSDEELTKRLARQDWAAVTKRLVVFAHRRLGGRSIETAQEIAQEAIARVWDPNYADWDPVTEPSIMRHLGSVVNGLIRNLNVSHRERAERAHDPEEVERAAGRSKDGADGDGMDRRIDAARVIDRFLDRTAGDDLVTRLLMVMADGEDKPAQQATKLGVPVTEVYNARRRLNGHVGPIRAEFGVEAVDGL
jgi:hypothetical protein